MEVSTCPYISGSIRPASHQNRTAWHVRDCSDLWLYDLRLPDAR